MFAAKEFQTTQQFSARDSSYLDDMTPPQHEHNYGLPMLISNAAFRGRHTSDSHCLITGQQNTVGGGVLKIAHPNCDTPHPIGGSPYLIGAQCALHNGIRITDKAINASSSPQKRFVIFDRSRNQTRLFFSPSCCPEDPFLAAKTPDNANDLSKEMALEKDQQFLEEHWDENDLTDGEGEMREDTEEINALLYSDSDDEGDGGDEVTSTGYSPSIAEEVMNSDEFPKRQKLIDGKYRKSSSSPHAEIPFSQPISHCCEDDVQSSCAGDTNTNSRANDDVPFKREKKVKIRQALTALASIIPGLSSNNDPLSIIDEAIVHLKSMRAEALQESYPEHNKSTTSFKQWGAKNH